MKYIVTILFVCGLLIFLLEMALKYFFNINIVHLPGLRNYLILISCFFAVTIGIDNDKNIKLDLSAKLSKNKIVSAIKFSAAFLTSVLMTVLFIKYTIFEKQNKTLSYFDVPRYIMIIPYLLVFLISSIYYLKHIVKSLLPASQKPQ